jgi:hypothetical protein
LKIGDLVSFNWAHDITSTGIVLEVAVGPATPGMGEDILYSFEILEISGKRSWFDVWRGQEDKVKVYKP